MKKYQDSDCIVLKENFLYFRQVLLHLENTYNKARLPDAQAQLDCFGRGNIFVFFCFMLSCMVLLDLLYKHLLKSYFLLVAPWAVAFLAISDYRRVKIGERGSAF